MNIKETAIAAYRNAKNKGFYDPAPSIESRLLLIHSEVSEACEAIRKNHYCPQNAVSAALGTIDDDTFKIRFEASVKNSFEDEIADTVIRCLDLCEGMGIDLEAHIAAKMRYNAMRPHKHGKAF